MLRPDQEFLASLNDLVRSIGDSLTNRAGSEFEDEIEVWPEDRNGVHAQESASDLKKIKLHLTRTWQT